MKRFLIGALLSLAWSGAALAQASCPTFYYGLVLTAAQWQACFDSKQHVLGYTAVNKAGDTMLGELVTIASTTARAGLNVPPGTAPTSPANGDFWTTSSGAFVRVGGVTIGPLGGGSSSSFAATSPLAVTFPAGVVTYAITGAAGRVLAGAGPAFTATPTLGVAGSVLGQLIFANLTTGSITLQAASGALGSAVLSLPATTDTLVTKASTDTLTNKSIGDALSVAGILSANSATASTAYTNGALVVTAGGVGVSGAIYSNSSINANGAFIVTGEAAGAEDATYTSLRQFGGSTYLWYKGSLLIKSGTTGGTGDRFSISTTGVVTFFNSMIYGGVTVSNAVTGTGPMVLGASPTITGHATIEGVTATGATGTGPFVFGTSPSISGLTVTGSFTATGLVGNASLANSATTVNGQTCTLGSSCTVTAAATTITVGSTLISGGTTTNILRNNAGTLAEYTISGSGTAVAMAAGATLTTATITSPTITGSSSTSIAALGLRDTSAAFDVTIAATSSTALTAGRTLTLNMQNVAHIVSFGTTANTGSGIIFPNTASDTVAMLGVANAFTGNNTYSGTNLFTGALATTGSNGQASIGASATAGAVHSGKGSSKDLTLANSAGTSVCDIATGGTIINCTTLTLTNQLAGSQVAAAANTSGAPSATFGVVKCDGTTTSCTSGVITVLGGAATSIAVGTTTVTSGTTNRIFYDNAGVLGELIIGNGIENSSGTLGITAARRTLPTTSIAASNNHTGGMDTDSAGTYTVPANVLWIEVFMVGGGGGGGGTAGAGSPTAGANTCIKASATPCTTPLLAAGGGGAGGSRAAGTGGTISGSGTANILAVAGGDGFSRQDLASAAGSSNGGNGGNSCLGGSGTGATQSNSAGAGKANTGGGGGSNVGTNVADPGGGGGAGACLRTIITSPAATYTYSVGAGGTAGTSAGAGGTGYIVVIEHYGT